MGAKKKIYVFLIVAFIVLAIFFAFIKNLVGTAVFLGLLFLLSFFKSEFYNLLRETGL